MYDKQIVAFEVLRLRQCADCAGLDARAAAIVMRTVRNTVNTGRTVVCTIHQPSIDIFEVTTHVFVYGATLLFFTTTTSLTSQPHSKGLFYEVACAFASM